MNRDLFQPWWELDAVLWAQNKWTANVFSIYSVMVKKEYILVLPISLWNSINYFKAIFLYKESNLNSTHSHSLVFSHPVVVFVHGDGSVMVHTVFAPQNMVHLLPLFFTGGGQSTARIASSNTVLRPRWVSAEHSKYFTAPGEERVHDGKWIPKWHLSDSAIIAKLKRRHCCQTLGLH